MKKHKILVVALAMAVMLVGSGYAYWTQTLTINNTVNTGYMDVGFTSQANDDWDNVGCSDLVTVGAIIATDKQSIDFTVNNFYPGAGASLKFVVANTGTVAAKIDTVTGTITDNTALCNALNYQFNEVEVTNFLGVPVYKEVINVNANNVPDLATGLTNALKNIVLQPGDTLMLRANGLFGSGEVSAPGYEILMPTTITGSQYEDDSAAFRLSLNFIQTNVN